MAWVPDSRTAGYLGPRPPPAPTPLTDDSWEDFLHDVISGISGLDPTLVRPWWQVVPANHPDFTVNWVGFAIMSTTPDWNPAIIHIDTPDGGYDALQEHEIVEILCTFYGPRGHEYASLFRRGIYIDQNRAVLRANSVGLVEVLPFTHAPELIKQQWRPRTDLRFTLRREIRYDYSVFSILRSKGQIIANPPFSSDDTIESDWDTDDVIAPAPTTDQP